MEVSVPVLGWLLVSTLTGLLAAGIPQERRGAATVLEDTEANPFQDRPIAWTGAWTEQRDEELQYLDYYGGGGNLIAYSEGLTANMTSGRGIGDTRNGRPLTRQNKPKTEQNVPALPGLRSPINTHVNDGPVKNNGEEPMNDREGLIADLTSGREIGDNRNGRPLTRQNKPKTEQNVPALPGLRSPINTYVNDGPIRNNVGEEPVNDKGQNTDGSRMSEQRNKREVMGSSQPPRRRARPPQPNCTGCYSSLNLQSDPSSSAEPDASE